jgi:hypothetical protein
MSAIGPEDQSGGAQKIIILKFIIYYISFIGYEAGQASGLDAWPVLEQV